MNVSALNFALVLLGLGTSAVLVHFMAANPGWGPAAGLSGLLAMLVTLVQPRAGLYLLVYSMLLSPGFSAGELSERPIQVRLDDVFLVLVFVAWFAITTLRREAVVGTDVPLIKPMLAYIAIALISSMIGIVRGTLGYRATFFYVLKYAEYYMLYYMAFNMIGTFEKAKSYLIAGCVTAVAVLAFAYQVMASGERPFCPFDATRGVHETATLAGYLMLVAGTAGGVALYARTKYMQVAFGALVAACIPPLMSTGSRATWLATMAMLLAMLAFGKGRRGVLVVAGVVGFYIFPHIFGGRVQEFKERVQYTFEARGEEMKLDVFGFPVTLEVSAATRLRKWVQMAKYWLPTHPFIGYGVTGVGLVDTQIPRVIGETGLSGFALWSVVMWGLLSRAKRVFEYVEDPLEKGLAFGFLCAYIGLFVQSFGVNSFIVIRIMEPFWFLAAIVMRLYVQSLPPAEKSVRSEPELAGLRRAFT